MPKVIYRIENAPGKIYGKNANELVFKEPSSGAVVYSTATVSGMLKSTRKQLLRGPTSEKDGSVCVATIDEPSNGILEMHHHHDLHSPVAGEGTETTTSSTLKMKKTTSWVPFSGNNNHAVTFRDAKYTWSGTTQLKRDRDGHVVAKVAGSWFWQGKLGDMEVDITSSSSSAAEEEGEGEKTAVKGNTADADREVLEMVLATFVLRWWGEKVKAEEEAREAAEKKRQLKREKEEDRKAVASQREEQEEKRKMEEQADESENKGARADDGTGKL